MKVACEHWKYWKFNIHWNKWNMSCHLNSILRRLHFVFILTNFFKYGLQDNHCVGYSVMKLVDYVAFQKIESMREGNNDESNNFEMEILDEGALDKVLTFPGKTLDGGKTGRQFVTSLTMNTSKNQMFSFQNSSY